MIKLLVLLIITLSTFVRADTINIPSGTELLFATNFEGVSFRDETGATVTSAIKDTSQFQGADTALAGNGYITDFATFSAYQGTATTILAIGNTIDEGSAQLVAPPAPIGTGRGTVLKFHSTQTATKTRVQTNSALRGYNKFTNSVMVYIPSNIKTLETYSSSMEWFTLMEFFNAPDYGSVFASCTQPPLYIQNTDCVPAFRTGVGLHKDNGKLVWNITTDFAGRLLSQSQKQAAGVQSYPTNGITKTDHLKINSTQEVLYDQWLTLNFYYERYPNRTDGKGRVKLQVVNAAGTATTVIDVSDVEVTDYFSPNRTYGAIKLYPLKMYTANYFVNHIFANSNPDSIDLYWDNWRLFSGDATVPDGTPSANLTPSKPTNLVVSKSGSNVNLSWSAPTTYLEGGTIAETITYDVRTTGQTTTNLGEYNKFISNQADLTASVTPSADGNNCFQVRGNSATVTGRWSDEVCLNFSSTSEIVSGDPQVGDFIQNSAFGSVASLTLTSPQQVPQGHLKVLCYALPANKTAQLESGNGFTEIASVSSTAYSNARDVNLRCFNKLAGASEPLTHTITVDSTPAERLFAFMTTFANPKADTPLSDFDVIVGNQVTSATLPAMTGGTVEATALAVFATFDNSPVSAMVPPSGYIEEVNLSNSAGGRVGAFSVSRRQSVDGTIAAATGGTVDSDVSNYVGMHILVSGLQIDATPNAFTLTDTTGHQNNSPLGAPNGACTAAISGLAADTTISISGSVGAEYNIDGGTYSSTPGTVGNGDVVCVRLNASDLYGSAETVTLDIGGVFADYTVTTIAIPNKLLLLGTPTSLITRNNIGATFTYANVLIYDADPKTNINAKVLVALQNVGVSAGIATGRETNLAPGSASLNELPDGTYWVLASRPSNGTTAISISQREVVTE